MRSFVMFSALLIGMPLFAAGAEPEVNLLYIGEGALVAAEPAHYGDWSALRLLDDAPDAGWACESGKISGNAIVFEMPLPGTINAFEFDTQSIDGDGRGAKDVVVEVSAASKDTGFSAVLRASLADKKDRQRFPVSQKAEGRWVRLTILNNHGDAEWCELFGFRGYGPRPAAKASLQITGAYQTNYNTFRIRQQGTAITGCYEYNDGLFEGTLEGRVAKLVWSEKERGARGPAVFVFAPDGRSFRGSWWYDTDKGRARDGEWNGERADPETGTCPHWSGSVGGELKKDLAATGRARLYGILFDTDSARLRPESLPTLDEVVRLLKEEAAWSLVVEGHTDSTGTAPHNQTLSEQRAKSVADYLTGKGIAAGRLTTAGFGQSKPVADNATELGRAQNRRVELVKK